MCTRKKGCCGASLQRTCMVIGIVYLVYTIILLMYLFVGYSSYSMVFSSQRSFVLVPGYLTMTNLIFSALTILICIFLILAAHFDNEYLIIPWFIGYAATIVQIIIANYKNRLIIFLVSQEGTIFDLTWSWDYNDDDPPGDIRSSERTERTSNNYNETQTKGFEFKAYISFCNIHECFVKFVIESSVLCYPISYYAELRRQSLIWRLAESEADR